MKKQLVLTITQELIPEWKKEARSLGISLSDLIEKRMQSNGEKPKFGESLRKYKDLYPEKSLDETKEEHLMEKYG